MVFNKRLFFVLFSIIFIISSLVYVSAEAISSSGPSVYDSYRSGGSSVNSQQSSSGVTQSFDEFAGQLLKSVSFLIGKADGSSASDGEILFIKLLVFFLILSIVTIALKKVPIFEDQKRISFVIAVAVSLISIRFVTTKALIEFIWLPYGVLGVLFSSLLPFIIGFFFIESFESSIVRKVGWTSFAVIFLGLGFLRWNNLYFGLSLWYQNFGLIYIAIAIISLLLIFFDRRIRAMMFEASLSKVSDRRVRIEAAELSHEITELKAGLRNASTPQEVADLKKTIRDKERRLKNMLD